GDAETHAARVEPIVGAGPVVQDTRPEDAPPDVRPIRFEGAFAALVEALAVRALTRAGRVVGAVAGFTGFADVIAAHRRVAADHGGGELEGAGTAHALDQDVPGARRWEREPAVGVLARAGGVAVVVGGRGLAVRLGVEVEVGLAVVAPVHGDAELVGARRNRDAVGDRRPLAAQHAGEVHDGGARQAGGGHASTAGRTELFVRGGGDPVP